MAKAKKLYMAQIGYSGDAEVIDVDVFALPYDRFNAENPLVILESVDLGKAKNKAFPDFSNVVLEGGCFNCNEFRISPDTVLPYGFDVLACDHAISDLGNLIGVLPSSVGTVLTRQAVLNAVKNKKPEALQKAKEFMDMYPCVNVTDGKQYLSDIMAQIYAAPQVAQTLPEVPVAEPEQVSVAVKTDEWLSSEEVCAACKQASEIISALSDEDTERYVKYARGNKARLKIRKQQMLRADGCEIVCIHRDDISLVVDCVLAQIESDKKRADKESKKQEKKAAQPKTEAVKPVESGVYVGDVELKPTKIKKYILDSVWKSIQTECGKNTTLLRQILNDIEEINVVPKKVSRGAVFSIKDNKAVKSDALEYKNYRCVAQGFESQKSAQRIVWGIVGPKLIAQYFFADHDNPKSRVEYRTAINNIDAEADFVANPDKYLLVSDLLSQMGERGEVSKADAKTEPAESKPEKPVVVADNKPAKKNGKKVASVAAPVVLTEKPADVAPVRKPKKRIRVRVLEKIEPRHRAEVGVAVSPDATDKGVVSAAPVVDSVMPVSVQPAAVVEHPVVSDVSVDYGVGARELHEPARAEDGIAPAQQVPEWVDIASLHAEFTVKLNNIKTQIYSLANYMNSGIDIREMREMNHDMGDLLEECQKCEDALAELEQMNARMKCLSDVVARAHSKVR